MESFKNLSEKERLYYSKVALGAFIGVLAGILHNINPQISVAALWLLALLFLLLLGFFARKFLGIEEMPPSRVYLSGTFTYFLFFILTWVIIIMLFAPELLLPPS
ncbi:MAG: hypothetical protein ACE5I5_10925 [Candidatus Heimdallarchaeota archaeon]